MQCHSHCHTLQCATQVTEGEGAEETLLSHNPRVAATGAPMANWMPNPRPTMSGAVADSKLPLNKSGGSAAFLNKSISFSKEDDEFDF